MNALEQLAALKVAEASFNPLSRTLAESADPRLPAHLLESLPLADEHAKKQMARVAVRVRRKADKLGRQLTAVLNSKRNFEGRYSEFLRIVDELAAEVAPDAACKRGCSHCCNIPLSMPSVEAEILSRRVGVPAHAPKDSEAVGPRSWGYDQPCPFLRENQCSIYAHRPVACRTHFSMAPTSLQCELLDGMLVPVPYADMRAVQGVFVQLCQGSVLGDIRDFFPTQAGSRRKTIPIQAGR